MKEKGNLFNFDFFYWCEIEIEDNNKNICCLFSDKVFKKIYFEAYSLHRDHQLASVLRAYHMQHMRLSKKKPYSLLHRAFLARVDAHRRREDRLVRPCPKYMLVSAFLPIPKISIFLQIKIHSFLTPTSSEEIRIGSFSSSIYLRTRGVLC